MINYFFDKDNEKLFRMGKFIETECIIMSQWDTIDFINNMNEKDFINRFSLFMCHTMDELKEVYDATDKENFLEEIIDVMMYSASALNLFIIKRELLLKGKETNLKEISQLNSNELVNIDKELYKSIKDIDTLTAFIMRNCSGIRENFPQRKWHKQNVVFTNEGFVRTCNKCIDRCISNIIYALSFLLNQENNLSALSSYINKKQRKIVNDAIMTGNNDELLHTLKEELKEE